MIHDHTEESILVAETNTEEDKPSKILLKEPKNSEIPKHDHTVSYAVQQTSSDEGWQEASSKLRSGNGAGRKFGRRRPDLAKLNVSNSEYSVYKDSSYRREAILVGPKTTPKTISMDLINLKQSKASVSKVSPKISPSHASLTAMASKSLSYKEVAVAPPSTILKPFIDRVEELKKEKPDTQLDDFASESMKEDGSDKGAVEEAILDGGGGKDVHESGTESEKSDPEIEWNLGSSSDEKLVETNGSKLSVSAPPFNPSAFPLAQPLNSVSVTSVYDVLAIQGMLVEPVGPVAFPPIAARVPCGPRSPLYYRTSHSFRMKHGFLKCQSPVKDRNGFTSPNIMNPNAPEFVPRRAWQVNPTSEDSKVSADANSSIDMSKESSNEEKFSDEVENGRLKKGSSDAEKAELARQILLSFIVKSVQNESVVSEKKSGYLQNSSEAIANDSAIIKILYGNEEKDSVSQMGKRENPETVDVNKSTNGDGEGFVVVTKRRRKKQQFTTGVNGLYNQQSICASV